MSSQKILVAIDDSQLTPAVFEKGLELALFSRGSLLLLHCLCTELIGEPMVPIPVELGLYPEMMNSSYETWHSNYEKQRFQGETILHHYWEIATDQGVPTQFQLTTGEPGLCLCQAAKNWGADLIVLGRRGRTGLTEALLGSVSNHVLHHAPCSIFVVQTEGTSMQKLSKVVVAAKKARHRN